MPLEHLGTFCTALRTMRSTLVLPASTQTRTQKKLFIFSAFDFTMYTIQPFGLWGLFALMWEGLSQYGCLVPVARQFLKRQKLMALSGGKCNSLITRGPIYYTFCLDFFLQKVGRHGGRKRVKWVSQKNGKRQVGISRKHDCSWSVQNGTHHKFQNELHLGFPRYPIAGERCRTTAGPLRQPYHYFIEVAVKLLACLENNHTFLGSLCWGVRD